MKRTPLARRIPLSPAALTPGTVAPRRPLQRREQRPGERPRAERLAGTRSPGNPIPAEARALVRYRSAGQCEIRGAADCTFLATDVHHRKRRRDGGHAASNLLDACSSCHRYAHANPQEARDRGWIVSAFAVDPALEPLRYGNPIDRHTWLHDDGTKTTGYITP